MKILFNDIIQLCDVPASLKSPALSDTTEIADVFIYHNDWLDINAVGIGNTDGTYFDIAFYYNNMMGGAPSVCKIIFKGNGLYALPGRFGGQIIEIVKTDATYIGRFAAGTAVSIPTSVAKQPGWASTAEPRTTLSGQVIPGAGGYNYRTLSLDSRYKLGKEALSEIEKGYRQIGQGYPFFIDLPEESYKLPFSKLYATENDQRSLSFEGGITRFLYSRRWEFKEAF